MCQFKLTHLHAISEKPQNDDAAWLIEAESSIKLLKENAQNDEVVIYAIGNSVLIHGALVLEKSVTAADRWALQNMRMDVEYC